MQANLLVVRWLILPTGTFILKGGPVDEALGLLDDHIVKSQAMTASPFAKPFMERLQPWERKLVRFQVRHGAGLLTREHIGWLCTMQVKGNSSTARKGKRCEEPAGTKEQRHAWFLMLRLSQYPCAILPGLQDILDQWLKCQGKWQYLEPIFGAEEIMKQIPREGQAFRDMDAIWRRIMEKVILEGRTACGARAPMRDTVERCAHIVSDASRGRPK